MTETTTQLYDRLRKLYMNKNKTLLLAEIYKIINGLPTVLIRKPLFVDFERRLDCRNDKCKESIISTLYYPGWYIEITIYQDGKIERGVYKS